MGGQGRRGGREPEHRAPGGAGAAARNRTGQGGGHIGVPKAAPFPDGRRVGPDQRSRPKDGPPAAPASGGGRTDDRHRRQGDLHDGRANAHTAAGGGSYPARAGLSDRVEWTSAGRTSAERVAGLGAASRALPGATTARPPSLARGLSRAALKAQRGRAPISRAGSWVAGVPAPAGAPGAVGALGATNVGSFSSRSMKDGPTDFS